jgi:glycosyltransferase involved in cell wall biosynthesis
MRLLTEIPLSPAGKTGWPWTETSPPLPDAMPDGSPWPRVSIVTPSYNQGLYIEETIRSVLLQGYPHLEYLIMDGGSTDTSVQLIRKYEAWIDDWVSEKDRGQSHAINKGWERARGQIITYLNSDDTLAPGAVRRVAEAFHAHPEAAVVYGDCNLTNGEGQLITTLRSQSYNRSNLLLADFIQQSSAFVRRSAVEQVGLLDEAFHMAMDYEYWVRLAIAGFHMHHLPAVLSMARLTADTKTGGSAVRFCDDSLLILDRVYDQRSLPADVRRVKRAAYGNVWRLGGVRYFDAGHRGRAIKAMLTALRWNPLPGWRPWVLSVLVMLQCAVGVHWWSARTVEKLNPTR